MTVEADDSGGFRTPYGVELLYSSPPNLQKSELFRSLRKRCPDAQPLDGNTDAGLLAFVYPDHPIQLKDATIAPQTFITVLEQAPSGPNIESALQQSWSFPEARSVVERCTASIIVTDLLSSGLPYRKRLNLFEQALLAVLDVAPPDAIHWVPTQRIVSSLSYIRAARESPAARFFAGPINVRFFNIADGDDEMLMDTLGLAALGLPDLQCHFRKLDPDNIVRLLYNLAFYVFENGDVFEDGHTVEGVTPGSKWTCQHQESLVAPEREVLDIDPGHPHAAGERKRK